MTDETVQNHVLYKIEDLLDEKGHTLASVGFPAPTEPRLPSTENRLVSEQMSFNTIRLRLQVPTILTTLTSEQRIIYDVVVQSVNGKEGRLFFVYGHGGTGKTHLWHVITTMLRSEGKIVLAVASSGIASLLLEGGTTAYSRFKIPIDLSEESTCNVRKNTLLCELIEKTDLIIWDEAPMSNRICFEALNRMMCDLLGSRAQNGERHTFGGKTVLLGGDFRQTLPIISRGTRYDTISASIATSVLWRKCTIFRLTVNMRLRCFCGTAAELQAAENFADWILAVENGSLPVVQRIDEICTDDITIPEDLLVNPGTDELEAIINAVYPNLQTNFQSIEYLQERAIVMPKNTFVDKLNEIILNNIPTEQHEYFSIDTADASENVVQGLQERYPIEFLNNILAGSIAPHRLVLKVGVPVMLLRNIDQPNGLCNGTRLMVVELSNYHIEAKILTGVAAGRRVHIPRIVFIYTDINLPFKLRRKQFPVRVSYAMSINKSQGQSLNVIVVYLPKPIFSHCQLYVALSRTTSRAGLKILISNDGTNHVSTTKNIVYKEIFSAIEA